MELCLDGWCQRAAAINRYERRHHALSALQPVGSPIETDGIGNLNASFIGNLLDMNTGLIYVGNGQYYDPETGRFLTRGVQSHSANPYVPWNPVGAIFVPLSLLSLFATTSESARSDYLSTSLFEIHSCTKSCPTRHISCIRV